MSVTIYQTDAVIVTDFKSMEHLVEWANGDMAPDLTGKKILVVDSGSDWTTKEPTKSQRTVHTLFLRLLIQARKRKLDFVFILNHPEHLDVRIRYMAGQVREFAVKGEQDGQGT